MVVKVGQARMAPLAVHAQEKLCRAARRLQPRAVARSAGAAAGARARPASCASLTRPQLRARRSVFTYISGHNRLMRPAADPPPAPRPVLCKSCARPQLCAGSLVNLHCSCIAMSLMRPAKVVR